MPKSGAKFPTNWEDSRSGQAELKSPRKAPLDRSFLPEASAILLCEFFWGGATALRKDEEFPRLALGRRSKIA